MNGAAREENVAAIRAAEERIAQRLSLAEGVDEEVAAAHQEAARIAGEASVKADSRAREVGRDIDAAGQTRIAEARRVGAEAVQTLGNVAARRVERDVVAVVSAIAPRILASSERREGHL